MPSVHRFLGFAFACADLLIEVGDAGKITFAVGAAAALAGSAEGALIGKTWRGFVDARDQPLVEALFDGLDAGARQGPVIARLAPGTGDPDQAVSISACRLPQNQGAISCALTRARAPSVCGSGGLLDRAAFETITRGMIETARAGGQELELAFVEMQGLSGAAGALSADAAQALKARLAGALRAQSHGGAAAADLGEDRFALVRGSGEPPDALSGRLSRLMSLVTGTGQVTMAARAMTLDSEATPSKILRAIRYALDDFLRDGMAGAPPASLSEAVNASVRHTLEKANALGDMVARRRFRLVYQPVVVLQTGELHHHEALVRFGDDESPFPMIRMAEELDLIEGLDLAIVEQALAELTSDPKLRLAVNVSGRTIISPGFIDGVGAMLAHEQPLNGRLMFELTESAAIEDLALADRHIQALRAHGCSVCLDDFGAGAASLAYLQQLHLDVVKIDGRYIRELQHGGRQSTFIRHLVRMCAELNVKTLAEMVETAQAEDAVRKAGVDFAQGWLYGAASDRPEQPSGRRGPSASRRVGAVESWG